MHYEAYVVFQCCITIFVGAGSSAGVQHLQRESAKLDQLGRSHVLEQTRVSPVAHVLREKQTTFYHKQKARQMGATETWRDTHKMFSERDNCGKLTRTLLEKVGRDLHQYVILGPPERQKQEADVIKPTHRWMHLNFKAAKTMHRFRWYLYC